MSVLAASNFCSCARILIIPPPTNYIALIGAPPKQKVTDSVRAHCLLMSRILLFFARLQIVVDESGNTISGCSPTACWHLSD
jgi:hypothetical protein